MLNAAKNTPPKDTEQQNAEFERVVARAIKGDSGALYSVCEVIAKNVLFYTLRLINEKNDAEDVAQEVLMRVCESIRQLREPKAFKVWLARIISNEVRRHFKKQEKSGVVLNIEDYWENLLERQDDFLPQEYAEKEETRQAVIDIVETLPTRQREAVFLHYYYGLSVTEVAEAMEIDASSVSKYIAIARDKIRQAVNGLPDAVPRSFTAAFPTGTGMFAFAGGEALMDSGEAWAQRALGQCGEYIKAHAPPAEAPRPKPKQNNLFWPVASVAATLLAAAGTFLGINTVKPRPVPPAASISSKADFSGDVAFSGGRNHGGQYAYQNPTGAAVSAISGTVPLEWQITDAASGELLYSGKGGNPGKELGAMVSARLDGVYWMRFLVEDASGDEYWIGNKFFVDTSEGVSFWV